MIVDGKKTIETRTWKPRSITKYRDLLLIGSKNPKGRYSGKAACIVNVADCYMMGKRDEEAACCEVYYGAWAWFLENVRPVWPVAIKGQLRIYDVDDELVRMMGDESLENILDCEREWFIKHGFIKDGQYELELG